MKRWISIVATAALSLSLISATVAPANATGPDVSITFDTPQNRALWLPDGDGQRDSITATLHGTAASFVDVLLYRGSDPYAVPTVLVRTLASNVPLEGTVVPIALGPDLTEGGYYLALKDSNTGQQFLDMTWTLGVITQSDHTPVAEPAPDPSQVTFSSDPAARTLWLPPDDGLDDTVSVTVSGSTTTPVDIVLYKGNPYESTAAVVVRRFQQNVTLADGPITTEVRLDSDLGVGSYYLAAVDQNACCTYTHAGSSAQVGQEWIDYLAPISVDRATVTGITVARTHSAYPYRDGYQDSVGWQMDVHATHDLRVHGSVSIRSGTRFVSSPISTIANESTTLEGSLDVGGFTPGTGTVTFDLRWGSPEQRTVVTRTVDLKKTASPYFYIGQPIGSYSRRVLESAGSTPIDLGLDSYQRHLTTPFSVSMTITHKGKVVWKQTRRLTAPFAYKDNGNTHWRHGRLDPGRYLITAVIRGPDGSVQRTHVTWTTMKRWVPINK